MIRKGEFKTPWYKMHVCVKCEHWLGIDDYMNSFGVCPYCGHSTNGTICEATPIAVRRVYKYKIFGRFYGLIGIDKNVS